MAELDELLKRVTKLSNALNMQAAVVKANEKLYEGDHALPELGASTATRETEAAYKTLLKDSITNFLALVSDAPVERLEVIGHRSSAQYEGIEEASRPWDIWQRNHLDSDQSLLFGMPHQLGAGYALVWPDAEGKAEITIEHPLECIVEYDRGSRWKRSAALKRWVDESSGKWYATLYLPTAVYKFQTKGRAEAVTNDDGISINLGGDVEWERREVVGELWPLKNSSGLVPIVEFSVNRRARGYLYGSGRSEFWQVRPIQNRINRALYLRLITGEFQSFRQRWATGVPVKKDANGQPVSPFDLGPTTLWATSGTDVKFGEFKEADLGIFTKVIDADLTYMATLTRTPKSYLDASMTNVSAEAVKSHDAGMLSKTARHATLHGENIEEVLRVALKFEGDTRAEDHGAAVLWADLEHRTWGETVDALLKMKALGVPEEELWLRLPGANQQDVARWKAMQAGKSLRESLFEVGADEDPEVEAEDQ